MFPFKDEQKFDCDELSRINSFKDLDLQSLFIVDSNVKNDEISRLFNMNKNLDNSMSEPLINEKPSKTKSGTGNLLNINNSIIFGKDKKPYFEILHKPRGRKKTKRGRTNKYIHDKYEKDNILKKLKVHSINFIFNLVNFVLMVLGENIQFRIISHAFKKEVKYGDILSLKKMKIKEILCQKLSPKIKINKNYDNTTIFNSIKEPIIKNWLSTKFIDVFKNLYYNNKEKKINLKDYGSDVDQIYNIPKTIETFEELLRKNKNNYIYNKKLNECVENNIVN